MNKDHLQNIVVFGLCVLGFGYISTWRYTFFDFDHSYHNYEFYKTLKALYKMLCLNY